jgi:hypothetical protein
MYYASSNRYSVFEEGHGSRVLRGSHANRSESRSRRAAQWRAVSIVQARSCMRSLRPEAFARTDGQNQILKLNGKVHDSGRKRLSEAPDRIKQAQENKNVDFKFSRTFRPESPPTRVGPAYLAANTRPRPLQVGRGLQAPAPASA